jgi:hypothetical protein
MTLREVYNKYLGWCPGTSSASSFKHVEKNMSLRAIILITTFSAATLCLFWSIGLFNIYTNMQPHSIVKLSVGRALPVENAVDCNLIYAGKLYYNYPVQSYVINLILNTPLGTQNYQRQDIVFSGPGYVFNVGSTKYLVIECSEKEIVLGIID